MIKTLPISAEEQSFVIKSVSHGLMNGFFTKDMLLFGSISLVFAAFFLIRSARQKHKNPHRKFASILMFIIAFIFLLLSFVTVLSKITPIGLSLDVATNISQVLQLIGMILADPEKWWRYLLLGVAAFFIPRVILNLFKELPWHYSSIGKFANMFVGAALTFMGILTLAVTGKTRAQIDEEQRQQELKELRLKNE